MNVNHLLQINSLLIIDDNVFSLWPPNEYHSHPVLTLKSKYGFRRFKVANVDADLLALQQRAIIIDEALCINPVADEFKKFVGVEFIPL